MKLRSFLRNHSLLILLLAALLPEATAEDAVAESAYAQGSNPVLKVNLVGFDALTGDLKARLNLKLPKDEITPRYSPKHTYTLVDLLAVNGVVTLSQKSDVPYSAFDNYFNVVYEVDDAGSQFLYPFDHHRAQINIFVDREEGRTPEGPVLKRVPLDLDTNLCSFEGYNITITPAADNSPTFVDLFVDLRRTTPIRCYSVFVCGLMLMVSVGVFRMALMRHRATSAPEMNEMAFCAALLFAFPAIRNAQPFAPPMGVLSDYFGFFWAESLVAISLIIKLRSWLRRKKHT